MKILFVTNMFPDEERIFFGIFVKEQIEFYAKTFEVNYEVFFIDGEKTKFNYVKSIFKINRLIAKGKFDLVHIHFGLSGMFLLFNPFLKIPTILTLHGCDIQPSEGSNKLIQVISGKVAAIANNIIVLNDNMVNILSKYHLKLTKIPCGINLKDFSPERHNFQNKKMVIGFPSSRSRLVKNFIFFQKIIDCLTDKGYETEVVEFNNFTKEQVGDQLSKLDCLVMTSISEGSPQIIKEAMACNVPVISTNVGDVEFLLKDVENCFVLDFFDENLFAEKIIGLIKLSAVQRKSTGRSRIKQLGLEQNQIVSKLHSLYGSLLKPIS